MTSLFHIHVDRLREGKKIRIEESLDPSFLSIEEDDLKFPKAVKVQGEAYLAEDHFVLRLTASTDALLPCIICNGMTSLPLRVENFYFTLPLVELASPVFDYSDPLREALLLELPHFAECNGGNCPEREGMTVYLKKNPSSEDTSSTHFPFSDLEKE